MNGSVPSKERIGLLIDYWTAKLQSHKQWPQVQGRQDALMGLIYEHTIAALRQLHSAPEPCADQLAAKDAMDYGSGFVRVMPDGSREHVPHHEVFIEPSDDGAAQPPRDDQ